MKKILLTSLLSTISTICLYAGIEGEYKIKGYDPNVPEYYSGFAEITKDGDVYTVHSRYNDGSHEHGTGIRKGNQISFVTQRVENPTPATTAVTVCKITSDPIHIKSSWIYLGGNLIGKERLHKINSSNE